MVLRMANKATCASILQESLSTTDLENKQDQLLGCGGTKGARRSG